jgi:hypothetical protein
MPENATVYIVLIAAAAAVVALMVWKGTGGKFTWGNKTFEVKDGPRPPSEAVIAEEMKVSHGQVGNITGVRDKSARGGGTAKADVASRMVINHGKVGDITGIEISGGDSPSKNK